MNGLKTGPCPFADEATAREAVVNTQDAQPPDASCEKTTYAVSRRTTLEAGDPNHRSTLETVGRRHPSVFIDAQVPGLRFITKCRGTYSQGESPPEGCMNAMTFWRDESQFAPELGVQWSLFREAENWYVRELSPGTGQVEANLRRRFEGPVRYSISAPDGHVVTSGVADDIHAPGPMAI